MQVPALSPLVADPATMVACALKSSSFLTTLAAESASQSSSLPSVMFVIAAGILLLQQLLMSYVLARVHVGRKLANVHRVLVLGPNADTPARPRRFALIDLS